MKPKALKLLLILLVFGFNSQILAESQRVKHRKLAIQNLREAVKLSGSKKEQPEALMHLADQYKDLAEAYRFDSEALLDKINPNLSEAKREALRVEIKSEQRSLEQKATEANAKAEKIYRLNLKRFADHPLAEESLMKLGELLEKNGKKKEALNAFQKLTEKYPKSEFLGTAHLSLGELYFGLGNILRAELNYKKTIKIDNGSAKTYALYKLGWCKYNLNEFDKSRKIFSLVLNKYLDLLGPKQKEPFARQVIEDYNLAYSRTHIGGEAREILGREIPRFYLSAAQISLGKLFLSQGKNEDSTIILALVQDDNLDPEDQIKLIHSQLIAAVNMKIERLFKQHNKNLQRLGQNLEEPEKSKALKNLGKDLKKWAISYHKLWMKSKSKTDLVFSINSYMSYNTIFTWTKDYPKTLFLGAELSIAANLKTLAMRWYKKVQNPKYKDYKHYEKSFFKAYFVSLQSCQEQNILDKNGNLIEEGIQTVESSCIDEMIETAKSFKEKVNKSTLQADLFFQTAVLLHKLKRTDESMFFFTILPERYPENAKSKKAADHVLSYYDKEKDYNNLKTYGLKFLANPILAVSPYKERWRSAVEGIALIAIEKERDKQEPIKTAEDYYNFAQSFPASKHASTALLNSAFYFGKAGFLNKEIETREQFVAVFPKDKGQEENLWGIAKAYQQSTEYELLPNLLNRIYLKLKSEKALAEKCRVLILLKNQFEAEKCILSYLENFPKKTTLDDLLAFSARQFKAEKFKAVWKKVIRTKRINNPKLAAIGLLQLAKSGLSIRKIKKQISSLDLSDDEDSYFQERLIIIAANSDIESLKRIKLELPQRKLSRNVKKLIMGMGKLSKKLGPLLSSVHKENVVSSTVILAKLFKTISDSLLNAPDPPNMSPDELALYKQQLGEQALPLEDQARKIVEALASQPNIFHPELSSLRTMRFNLDTPNLIFYPRDWFQILGSNFKLRIPKAYNIPEIKQEVANSQNKLEKALETGL